MSQIKPRTQTPGLEFQTLAGHAWKLSDQSPKNLTMVVAYRGLHCPKCEMSLRELDRLADEFKSQGVDFVALSCDTQERAQQTQEQWALKNVPLGYGLTIDKAREWGLFISNGHGKTSTGLEEPAQFSEPGVFLVKPDGTLYASIISTMPFARPHFKELSAALGFVIEKGYPARGEA